MPHREQVGTTYNRANAVRPMDASLMRLHAWAAAFCAVMAGICLLPGANVNSGEADALDGMVQSVLGFAFALICLLAGLSVLLDLLRGKLLSNLSIDQMRRRLQRADKEHRFRGNPRELRGYMIGTVFFGIALLVAIVMRVRG